MQNLIYCHMWQRGEGALTIGTASRQHNHSQSQSPLYAFAKTVPVNVLTQCQRCLTVAHLLVVLMQCVSHHHIKQNVVQMFHAAISEKIISAQKIQRKMLIYSFTQTSSGWACAVSPECDILRMTFARSVIVYV